MAELNKIMIIGRLTKDPELRYTAGGAAVATLRMAVNHTYRAKEGQEKKKEEVLFIDVNVWNKAAETVKQYLTKGRELFVEGRLQMNDWTDKQGQKRRDFRVVADNFQFLGGGQGQGRGGPRDAEVADDGGSSGGPPVDTFDGGEAPARQDAPGPGARAKDEKEDDLPF